MRRMASLYPRIGSYTLVHESQLTLTALTPWPLYRADPTTILQSDFQTQFSDRTQTCYQHKYQTEHSRYESQTGIADRIPGG